MQCLGLPGIIPKSCFPIFMGNFTFWSKRKLAPLPSHSCLAPPWTPLPVTHGYGPGRGFVTRHNYSMSWTDPDTIQSNITHLGIYDMIEHGQYHLTKEISSFTWSTRKLVRGRSFHFFWGGEVGDGSGYNLTLFYCYSKQIGVMWDRIIIF